MPVSGSAGTSQTRVGTRSVTKAPQELGVAGAELAVDPLRERRRDRHDQGEVEERPELDHVGQASGHGDREQGEPVLGDDQPEQLEQDRPAGDHDRDPHQDERDGGVLGVRVAEPSGGIRRTAHSATAPAPRSRTSGLAAAATGRASGVRRISE